MRTFGRLINWAPATSEACNLGTSHYTFRKTGYKKGLLLYATKDIAPFTQLHWDYCDPLSKNSWMDVKPGRYLDVISEE